MLTEERICDNAVISCKIEEKINNTFTVTIWLDGGGLLTRVTLKTITEVEEFIQKLPWKFEV